jgi:hypothetical protein
MDLALNDETWDPDTIPTPEMVGRQLAMAPENAVHQATITLAINQACGPGGAFTNAIANAITAACQRGGAVSNAITAACGPNGAIKKPRRQFIEILGAKKRG